MDHHAVGWQGHVVAAPTPFIAAATEADRRVSPMHRLVRANRGGAAGLLASDAARGSAT